MFSKSATALAALVVAVAFASVSAVPVYTAQDIPMSVQADLIDGEYIVSLTRDTDMDAHLNAVRNMMKTRGGRIFETFTIGDDKKSNGLSVFKGYLATFSEAELELVKKMHGVQGIENNQRVYASDCVTQEGATWGLVRTSEKALKINGEYSHDSNDGSGVDVYIIDTGIYTEHEDFEGRAVWGFDAVDAVSRKTDGNGHGTHVAGTVISKTYGLAKKATAVAVRVLSDSGSGTTAGVISGIEWAAAEAGRKKKPSVANMSLGGGYSKAMNDATKAAVDAGLTMVVAAGNSRADACSYSPASEPSAITVGSTDNTDTLSSFSNHGTCVHILAPGTGITSTWIGAKDADNTISGTSMASPHVAGLAAKYLTTNPSATPAQIKAALVAAATPGIIKGVNANTPNLLGHKGCA